jgi:hypothetical protein
MTGDNIKVLIDGVEVQAIDAALDFQVDQVDVTALFEIDPLWQYTDRAGHYHAHSKDTPHYPTLVERVRHHEAVTSEDDDDEWDGDEHEWDERYLVCALCEEEIKPGMRSGQPRTVPGRQRTEATITIPAGVDGPPTRTPCSLAFYVGDAVRAFGIAIGNIEGGTLDHYRIRYLFTAAGRR